MRKMIFLVLSIICWGIPFGHTFAEDTPKCDVYKDVNAEKKECCSSSKIYYNASANEGKGDNVCCNGVLLNTNVPFIGQCIAFGKTDSTDDTEVTEENAFPKLMGGLTKMMVTIILLMSFVGILAGGVMIAADGGDDKRASTGKGLIKSVVIGIALLGASGIILRLINPNFFK